MLKQILKKLGYTITKKNDSLVGVHGIHIEDVGHDHFLNMPVCMMDAMKHNTNNKMPSVFHKNYKTGDYMVTMNLEDWAKLQRAYEIRENLGGVG